MTEKRYFINVMQNIEDRVSGVILCGFSQLVDRLNEYDEKYSQLFTEYSELQVDNEQLRSECQRLRRKNKRLHQDWDKIYRLCLEKGFTEEEIIKELER